MTKKSKYDMPPVQNFAFGGIANPSQRAFLRSSDKSYLDARQKELDAFEQQRLAYNDSLTKWQTDVYNPYKAQVDAYNAASEKYNTDVYNPYKTQVDAYNAAAEKYNTDVYNPYKTEFQKYQEAVEAYNAGDRLTDYAGPAEPKLASEFGMTAPTAPKAFEMAAPKTIEDFKGVAPTLPFKEEEVQAYQQSAADRARKDAGQRAVAIDVVSNPDQFNFGSMSVANRFMAKGGEVMQDDASDRTASSIIKDFESYGYTKEEIMELADKVAAAGRGGDELLAYLSPESVEYLKANGGSGTINPMTGLPEFKGGVLGSIGRAVKRVFGGGGSSAPAAEAAAPARQSELRATRLEMEPSEVQDAQPVLQRRTTAAQDLQTVTPAPTPTPAPVTPPPVAQTPAAVTPTPPTVTPPAVTTPPPGTAADMLKSVNAATPTASTQQPTGLTMAAPPDQKLLAPPPLTPTPTPAAPAASDAGMINPRPQTNPNQALAENVLKMAVGRIDKDMKYDVNGDGKLNSADALSIAKNGMPTPAAPTLTTAIDQLKAGNKDEATNTLRQIVGLDPIPLKPKTQITAPGMVGGPVGSRTVTGGPVDRFVALPAPTFSPVGSANPIGKVNLGGRIGSPVTGRPGAGGSQPSPQRPTVVPTDSIGHFGIDQYGRRAGDPDFGKQSPTMPRMSDGPGYGGGSIPIFSPSVPSGPMFGNPNARIGGAATSPSSYFSMTPQTSTGLAPGSAAIGPADMPIAAGRNTLNAIGANPNLSPTMLGGQQNAGVMRDRLGNQIYSPGMGLFGPPGFAKGGDVSMADIMAMNTETLSDEQPEEVINTNPVGTAQKMLADLSGAGKASPTRQSIKRVKSSGGGGASADKGMKMSYEDLAQGDLGAMKDVTPSARNTDSARAQMEELARVYQMKIRAAQNKGRGLMADTLGAPSLEQPTLTKGSLTKKRFKDGGEAKKADAESAKEPGIFSVNSYATDASARMFPDQMGQDDQRDAVRHMLAAAAMSKKFGPGTAEFLGKAHERMSNPESFFSMFGIGKPRDDYEMDVHNNKLGAELGARTTSQAELEKLVRAMAMQAQNKQVEGKPWTMSKEQMKNRKGQITTQPPEYRAEGSPEEGEIGPAFVTPKSGKGRKEGEISRQLRSGDAYVNMAKGVTELPYDIAGAPVDLATMLLRPFGYSTEKPVMGSDFIKEKMTKLGVRPEPPADPTAKGFYTAGELLSNLTNPAAVSRKVGPVVEKGVKAGAMEVGRQLDRAILDDAGPLSKFVPQSAKPLYAVRPTGSTMLTGNRGLDGNVITVSAMDQLLANGMSNAGNVAGRNTGQAKLIAEFWDKKARNYFERQFGTPDDPIMEAIKAGRIKGTTLSSDLQQGFPAHLIDSLAQGKTRYKEGARTEGFVGPGAPEGRFFPKYPEAVEDFTSRYDKATGLKGNFLTRDPAAADPAYDMLSTRGREMAKDAADIEADKLIAQGVRPELINTEVGAVTRSVKDPTRVVGDGTSSAKAMYDAFEQAVAPGKTNEPSKTGLLNKLFGESKPAGGTNEAQAALNVLPENVLTALRKGEPVYDIGYNMDKRLSALFKPASVNEYLATLPPRELANIRFEDAIRGGLKLTERAAALDNVASRIKAGKPVADSVFSNGVSAPLLQIKEGPLEGFAWKRIEKREATVPEGAYVGHSVGGYELGGATYTKEKREGFNTGLYQVYTLRDNRNRPVNTVEVQMVNEFTPVVMQIKGNGRATGNVPAEKYDKAVLDFFENYLRPAKIEEKDEYLTPLLKTYKEGVNSTFKMP